MAKTTVMHATFLEWLIFAPPYQTNRKWNLKLYTKKYQFYGERGITLGHFVVRSTDIYTVRPKLSTTWLVSIISFRRFPSVYQS
jgi:hypothetical protein